MGLSIHGFTHFYTRPAGGILLVRSREYCQPHKRSEDEDVEDCKKDEDEAAARWTGRRWDAVRLVRLSESHTLTVTGCDVYHGNPSEPVE